MRYQGIAPSCARRFAFNKVSVFVALVAISHSEGDEAGIAQKQHIGGPLYDLFGIQGIEFFVIGRCPQLSIGTLWLARS